MLYTGILNDIILRAKKDTKTIVLPESNDIRVLKAANIVTDENISNVILVADEMKIKEFALKNNIKINNNIQIVNPLTYKKRDEYINLLYELRKDKGLNLKKAKELVKNNEYFATLMVKAKDADGMVSGAAHSTADTLRPALQIIKPKDGVNTVSAFFVIETPKKDLGYNGIFIFADCGLVEFPTKEQLVDIVNASVKSFRQLISEEAKVAMLSYSTKGSASSSEIDKINEVIDMIKKDNIDFEIDGELQLDAAIVKEVAKIKAPNSKVAGNANILIFPDLQSGNIGYKLVQRFGDALALGPITQGLNMPVNDLSRGCSVDDIVGTIAITCLQAK